MPPTPPVRGKLPSMGGIPRPSTQLPAVREEVAAGAVHSYRPPPSPDTAVTMPPPKPDPRPMPRSSMVGAKVPPLLAVPAAPHAHEEHEPTLVGIAPASEPPDSDGDRTTGEVSGDGLFHRYEANTKALAAEKARAATEQARAEAAELKVAEYERKMNARARATQRAETEPAPTLAQWKVLAFKFFGMLTVLGGVGAAYLEIAKANLAEKVANVAAKTDAQGAVTKPLPNELDKMKEWARAEHAHHACVDGVLRSALYRSTGYAVTSITETTVHWASENAKSWFPTRESDCPPDPEPP